jgi:polyhydroxyalkanoate synthesis regulator phasin
MSGKEKKSQKPKKVPTPIEPSISSNGLLLLRKAIDVVEYRVEVAEEAVQALQAERKFP